MRLLRFKKSQILCENLPPGIPTIFFAMNANDKNRKRKRRKVEDTEPRKQKKKRKVEVEEDEDEEEDANAVLDELMISGNGVPNGSRNLSEDDWDYVSNNQVKTELSIKRKSSSTKAIEID